MWPMIARSSSSHDEGGTRKYAMMTKRFSGSNGRVERLHGVQVRFGDPDASGRPTMEEVPGSEFELKADLVLLALGFLGPDPDGTARGPGRSSSIRAATSRRSATTTGRPSRACSPQETVVEVRASSCGLSGRGGRPLARSIAT